MKRSISNVLTTIKLLAPLAISILLVFFAAVDIVHEIRIASSYEYVLVETLVFFLGFLINLYFVHQTVLAFHDLKHQHQSVSVGFELSQKELSELKAEQAKVREGLYNLIEEQLKKWSLSRSEIEISFLILKGLSNKEIAEVRDTTESTVRLQCSAIYKKSSLSGRSELAAYFMEDMLFEPETSAPIA